MRFGELATAKAGAFHFFEKPGHRTIAIHLNGPRGRSKVLSML